jgi:hydroxyacylglutathione hydrolase
MKTTDKPTLQEFHIEGVKHIAPVDAMETLKNNEAVLIDVRETNEVKLESIALENVLYHPMSIILERLQYISKDQNIIVGCPMGVRSAKVANLLITNGYPNVANLDGGFTIWRAKGFPFTTNLSVGGGCGCGCNPKPTTDSKGSCC